MIDNRDTLIAIMKKYSHFHDAEIATVEKQENGDLVLILKHLRILDPSDGWAEETLNGITIRLKDAELQSFDRSKLDGYSVIGFELGEQKLSLQSEYVLLEVNFAGIDFEEFTL